MLNAVIPMGVCLIAGGAYLAPQWLRYSCAAQLHELARQSRSLVLTYDDGPGEQTTPAVAAILKAHKAQASFFLLGNRAERHPQILDQLLADGHDLACHTYSHTHAWKVAPWKSVSDISRGYQALSRWVANDDPFRPPYGKINLASWLSLKRRAARIVWWTIDSGDTWASLPKPSEIAEQVKKNGGGVVLLHDFDRSADRCQYVLETTELLLKTARSEGLNVRRAKDLWTK